MPETKVSFQFDENKSMELSTGKLAMLANGSCTVRQGDTVLLVAACSGPAREKSDFFPLQVDYREKYSAAGRFPGGYIKREGRPSDKEILTCRVTDRPVRPLFPKGFFDEVQIQSLLLSADGENESDVLCIVGASAALMLSDLPFNGPIGAVRVGYIDGKFVANPSHAEMKNSSLELIYAGKTDQVIMIEGEAKEVPENVLKDAMFFANEIVKKQIEAQLELAAKAGRTKKTPTLYSVPENIKSGVEKVVAGKIESACLIAGKEDRAAAIEALKAEAIEKLSAEMTEISREDLVFHINMAMDSIVKNTIREAILSKGYRPDGRKVDEIRPIQTEIQILPVVHGSGLFSRGETQALVIVTLGGPDDIQESDGITGGDSAKSFYLHYNFPNFSVGEVGRISGPGRREIGHGNLAERSIQQVVPTDFPYTIRCVSEVLASNGSTSMATVCGATLALMDAGVPIKAPVAGISCGLVTSEDGSRSLLLTDIIGAEDHFGDMDFKVCGTRHGVTGFQLDLKLPGIPIDLLVQAMDRNLQARLKILDMIEGCIPAPRPEISPNAPRIAVVKINPDKIGALIGKGGENIKSITEKTKASINIEDDGTVKIFAKNEEVLETVKREIDIFTAEAEVGKIYRGKVKGIKEFGAFVEILPGQEGLLHISEMANYRVNTVTDICKEGDYLTVKLLEIDNQGRLRLSRKAALNEIQ